MIQNSKTESLQSLIRNVPDFPKPGILFKDITPLLGDPEAREMVVEQIVSNYANKQVEAVAAIEARGFLFGILLAEKMNVPFIPVRKAGKLPFKKITAEYKLEYGSASIEMHEDAVKQGTRVLIHDDLLATGGTAQAAGNLIKQLGGVVSGFSFIITLKFLQGEENLNRAFGVETHSVLTY